MGLCGNLAKKTPHRRGVGDACGNVGGVVSAGLRFFRGLILDLLGNTKSKEILKFKLLLLRNFRENVQLL